MRVQVIANCQARPITGELAALLPEAQMQDPIILHLSKPDQEEAHRAQLDQADIIFAQKTADVFQPAHLASHRLRQDYDDKTVVWPNIFYSGQQPYLRYFTHPTHGRLLGPLEALHDLRLHRSWQDSGRVDPDAMFAREDAFEIDVRRTSLASLREKEAECDVTISDVIEAREGDQRLFFTFNHPSRALLREMALRLIAHSGLDHDASTPSPQNEPLNRYQVPSSWSSRDMAFQGDGYEVTPLGLAKGIPGKPVVYTAQTLCEAFQSVYDSHGIFGSMDNVRLTPASSFHAKLGTC